MSERLNNAHVVDIETSQPLAGSAESGAIPFQLGFEQLATAAEVLGDLAATSVALVSVYGVYHMLGLGKRIVYPIPIVVYVALTFGFFFVIMLDREGVYRKGSGMLRISETERTLRVSVQAFILLLPATIFAGHLVSRWVLSISVILAPVAVVLEKQLLFSIVRRLHARGYGVRNAIIYGSGFTGKRIYSVLLRSRKLGINPVVFVDDDEEKVGKRVYALGYHHSRSAPIISGPLTAELIKEYGAGLIVLAIPSLAQQKVSALADVAKETRIMLAFVPSQMIHDEALVDYLDIDGIMLARVNPPQRMYLYERTKRLVDLLLSAVGLVVLSPILALLAFAIRMDSEGPIIFKQQRVGKGGRLFEIYKFRTMRVDAPKYQHSPITANDQRITRVGRILRKTSLDELPQILNVIRGEMSLVGPRPEMPFIVETYGPRERQRLSVVPGITGLWQLSADRSLLIHENPQYDLYYIRNRGFFMDLAILMHTAMFAIKGI